MTRPAQTGVFARDICSAVALAAEESAQHRSLIIPCDDTMIPHDDFSLCRLFIDEVGNDDARSPTERYLSLTGVITKRVFDVRRITPELDKLKTEFFGHSQTTPVILHRRDIVRKRPPFDCLIEESRNAAFTARLLELLDKLPYLVITVVIDKHEHVEKYRVWQYNPYHYCMRALVERYILWMNRHNFVGDVVAEARFKKADKKLSASFNQIFDHGTEHIPPHIVQKRLSSRELKLRPKKADVAGLQLADLIAHPSHHGTRGFYMGSPMTGIFGAKVVSILESKKYSRNPSNLQIDGWGRKWLP